MLQKNFNANWRFYKEGKKAIEINLPHDAMLEEERIPDLLAGENSAYFPGGKYVYEKDFDVPDKTECAQLYFDGIYQKAKIELNGKKIAEQVNGYTGFFVDITEHMLHDKRNHLRVIVDNSQVPNSRWYTGSGIYRDVMLYVGNTLHIKPKGIAINTIDEKNAEFEIHICVEGMLEEDRKDISFEFEISDMDGKRQDFQIFDQRWTDNVYVVCVKQKSAQLWSDKNPSCYTLAVKLKKNGIIDMQLARYGLRMLTWNPKKGLEINGVETKLRGACIHHDNGILGAKEYEEIELRKIKILKECGYNAIRTAHNEPSEALLNACDQLGMYVMAEFSDVWKAAKNPYDYSLYFNRHATKDLLSMIQKCKRHPSVVMYSIGNEVYDTKWVDSISTCEKLVQLIRSIDDTRPITMGFNILGATSAPKNKEIPKAKVTEFDEVDPTRKGKKSPLVSSRLMNTVVMHLPRIMELVKPKALEKNGAPLFDKLDIVGLNYGTHLYGIHEINKNRLIVNTETFPSQIGKTWPVTNKTKYVVGDFMWTGWDHLGECGVGVVEYGKTPLRLNKPYPCIAGGVGSVNLVGEIEAQGWYTKAAYGMLYKPYISVRPLPHAGQKRKMSNWRGTDTVNSWAWGNQYYGQKVKVEIYCSGYQVELRQNGKSLGTSLFKECKAEFDVVYDAGILEAISYDEKGIELGRSYLQSAGEQSRLVLHTEKQQVPSGEVVYVYVEIVDESGIRKVNEDTEVVFTVSGSGELLGTGSGSPWARYPYTGNKTKTWYGTAAVVIQAKDEGSIKVTAATKEMKADEIHLSVVLNNKMKREEEEYYGI